jgi:hypothetical protein
MMRLEDEYFQIPAPSDPMSISSVVEGVVADGPDGYQDTVAK